MPAQDILTISQVRDILGTVRRKIVTRDAVISSPADTRCAKPRLSSTPTSLRCFWRKNAGSGIGGLFPAKANMHVGRGRWYTPA